MQVQWYPGHMTKARRMIEEDIKLIDLVIELLDARIPMSSRNPDIDHLAQGKARLVILCKSDLADPRETKKWIEYFENRGISAAAIDARDNSIKQKLIPLIDKACEEKRERLKRRGIKNRPMRALVCGIPNVGKSTFINSFTGKQVAKTGNKPGVTKGKQWIRLRKDVELLDSPGILWPNQSDESVGEKLAMIGSINDNILERTELASVIYDACKAQDSKALATRFDLESEDADIWEVLENIAKKRGLLNKGGAVDTEKAASILIDEFRKGQIIKITLDKTQE